MAFCAGGGYSAGGSSGGSKFFKAAIFRFVSQRLNTL
jgi:hypothetical protein